MFWDLKGRFKLGTVGAAAVSLLVEECVLLTKSRGRIWDLFHPEERWHPATKFSIRGRGDFLPLSKTLLSFISFSRSKLSTWLFLKQQTCVKHTDRSNVMLFPDLPSTSPAFKTTWRWNQESEPTAAKSTLERVSDTRLTCTEDSLVPLSSKHSPAQQARGWEGWELWREVSQGRKWRLCLLVVVFSSCPATGKPEMGWNQGRSQCETGNGWNRNISFPAPLCF